MFENQLHCIMLATVARPVQYQLGFFRTRSSAMAEGTARRACQYSTGPIMWHYLRDPTFSRFDTIPECDRHAHTDKRTYARRQHIPR